MERTEYIKMEEQESRYWWYVGRIEIIRKQLRKINPTGSKKLRILNVGSGTGGTIPMLQEFGVVYNVDVSEQALELLKAKKVKNLYKINDSHLPFKNNYFDIIVALDVLEHIEDHKEALGEWERVLDERGRIIITVPAYQWLWSAHDESLHHHKRYTTSELHRLCNKAGFKVTKRSYMIMCTFPLVVGYRFLKSVFGKKTATSPKTSHVKLPKIINSFFILLLRMEAALLTKISLPFGTSVLTIGQKKSSPK